MRPTPGMFGWGTLALHGLVGIGLLASPGLSWLLAYLPIELTGVHFRLVVAAFGAVTLPLTWRIGRLVAGDWAGAAAAVGLAFSPTFVTASSLVHPDIPAAALGMGAVLLLLSATKGDRVEWWAWGIVPVTAAATWIRFGAPIPIGVALAAVLAFRWRLVTRHLATVGLLGTVTAGISLVILRSPQLNAGAGVSAMEGLAYLLRGRSRLGFSSMGDFVDLTPNTLGPVALWLALVAVATITVALASRRISVGRGFGFAIAIALLTLVSLALVLPHGEARYLAPAIPWLFLALASALVPAVTALPTVPRAVAIIVVVALLPWAAVATTERAHERLSSAFGPLREASLLIAEDGFPCPVLTVQVGQVEWYSECETAVFPGSASAIEELRPVTVLLRQGAPRQPETREFEMLLKDSTRQRVFGNGEGRGERVWIYGFGR
jgi:hypothetical protein